MLKKSREKFPRSDLNNVYKSFVRPHIQYVDIIYYQLNIESFCFHIESVQYNACLAITIIFLFLRQKKITFVISLLIAQTGRSNAGFYVSGVVSVYLLLINALQCISLSSIMFNSCFKCTIRRFFLVDLASFQIS